MGNYRRIEFIGNIPLGQVDLFAKIVHNLCKNKGLEKFHISSDDLVISLLNEHVEAIANEGITYFELENSVRKSQE
jgi:hypothetical protein